MAVALELDTAFLAQQLAGLHYGLAILLQEPKWVITDDESAMLAGVLDRCAKAFNIAVDPRAVALSELVGVCAMIYVPRWMRKRVVPDNASTE